MSCIRKSSKRCCDDLSFPFSLFPFFSSTLYEGQMATIILLSSFSLFESLLRCVKFRRIDHSFYSWVSFKFRL